MRDWSAGRGTAIREEALSLAALRRYPRHLAIDPQTLGGEGWERMKEVVRSWLDCTEGGPKPASGRL